MRPTVTSGTVTFLAAAGGCRAAPVTESPVMESPVPARRAAAWTTKRPDHGGGVEVAPEGVGTRGHVKVWV